MKSNKQIFEQNLCNNTHPDNSPLYMPDLTNVDESMYQTVRGTVCSDVVHDQVVENIELIHEKGKTNSDIHQLPPKLTLIISNTVLYIQTPIDQLINNINSLLSAVTFSYEYKNRYSWVISYSNLQDNVYFNLQIYSTKISDVFLFEFQFQNGDKMLYSELFNFLYQKAGTLNILCDENGKLIAVEEKESNLSKTDDKEIPKLLNENIKRYFIILQSPYYETIKEELKSLIYLCNSQENRILLSNSGILDTIVMLKGKDKEIDGLITKIEDLVNSSCIECI